MTSQPASNKCKWALVCILAVVSLVAISSKPFARSSNNDVDTSRIGNLRSHHQDAHNEKTTALHTKHNKHGGNTSTKHHGSGNGVTYSNNNDPLDDSNEDEDSQNELLEALHELPLPTSYEELHQLNVELKELDPALILQWAHHHHLVTTPKSKKKKKTYPLVQVTSFGPTGLVILHLLSQLNLFRNVPIITMDTLHLFPESYEFYKTIQAYYESDDMKLYITKPLRMVYPSDDTNYSGDPVMKGITRKNEFDANYGSELWKKHSKRYTQLTKNDPLNRILDKWSVQMWITGRRRSSGGERSDMDILEFELHDETNEIVDQSQQPFDTSKGRWKINPLAYWTYNQVWEYIRSHELPYNVLYDKGYTSLGDVMTTDLPQNKTTLDDGGADALDAFERSGRFVGMNKTECGLHSHLKKVQEKKKQALESGEEFDAPTLVCDKCTDLDKDNFEATIQAGKNQDELLLEFYSPYCGGCQAFAPTMNHIANHLSSEKEQKPNSNVVQVARFDITENPIPNINGEELFHVETTPTLYHVRYSPSFHVELYGGDHDFDSILQWLTKSTPKDEATAEKETNDDDNNLSEKEKGYERDWMGK